MCLKFNFVPFHPFAVPSMIKVAEELKEGCTINLHQDKATWIIHFLSCVDDKRRYVDNLKKRVLKHLLEALENSIRTWDELLTFI